MRWPWPTKIHIEVEANIRMRIIQTFEYIFETRIQMEVAWNSLTQLTDEPRCTCQLQWRNFSFLQPFDPTLIRLAYFIIWVYPSMIGLNSGSTGGIIHKGTNWCIIRKFGILRIHLGCIFLEFLFHYRQISKKGSQGSFAR